MYYPTSSELACKSEEVGKKFSRNQRDRDEIFRIESINGALVVIIIL